MYDVFAPLQRCFDFRSRSRRAEYWPWTLTVTAIQGALSAITQMSLIPHPAWMQGVIWLFLGVTLIPSVSVTVRRLHDTNRTGWWALYAFVVPTAASQATFYGLITYRYEVAGAMGWSTGDLVNTALVVATGLQILFALPTLIFLIQDGTPGKNRFGPDPKGRKAASEVF
ncbi:MAG: DUF805 domain-containing protein [Asticcacaulis sp.]|nr:DUF805 domain-containing protein [Asticcacaulis sp.]